MNPSIFREHDIRGAADLDLDDVTVRAIGVAIGELAIDGQVVVGRDCRLTSPRLFAALTDGLRAHADVVDLGVVSTPVAYLVQQILAPAATVMITGGHDLPENNGFKVMIGQDTLRGGAINDLRDRVDRILGEPLAPAVHALSDSGLDLENVYVERAAAALRLGPRRSKIVVDAGNGSGGPLAVALYTQMGFDVVPLYCDPDGSFPNHHPDPAQPENLDDLIATVQSTAAEVGIALDGDARRVVVVDATGRILRADQLMILLGRALLAEVPGARFIGEGKCSQVMYYTLISAGGVVDMSKGDHAQERMKELGAQLAGEMSGQFSFGHRWLGFDDGIYAGARLLELISRTDRALADLAADLPIVNDASERSVDCPADERLAVIDRVAAALRNDSRVLDVSVVDGARVTFGNGWGLLQAPATESLLVVRCEAGEERAIDEISATIEEYVAKARAS